MEWIFIRHGETEDNIKRAFAGWTDSKLSEKGKKQVKQVASKLQKDLKHNRGVILYSSPLERTSILAQEIEKSLNKDKNTLRVQLKYMEGLKEVNFGIFEGLNEAEIKQRYSKEWNLMMDNYGYYSIPEGENLEVFHNRVVNSLDIIRKEGSEKDIRLIITHGGVIQSALTHFLGLSMESRWHFSIPNSGIIKIDVIDGFGILKSICGP